MVDGILLNYEAIFTICRNIMQEINNIDKNNSDLSTLANDNPGWVGESKEAFNEAISSTVRECNDMILSLTEVINAAWAYAEEQREEMLQGI